MSLFLSQDSSTILTSDKEGSNNSNSSSSSTQSLITSKSGTAPPPYIALITGGGSGIGQAMAISLALNHGWEILVTDLNLETAENTVKQIHMKEGKAHAFALNVGDNNAIVEFFENLKNSKIVDRIDVLINNAGYQYVSKLEDFPHDRWNSMIQVMLVGVADLTRNVLPLMKKNNFGRIINIGSIHAAVASPFKTAYVAAKHGLLGFSKVIALETADYDITINTICPSYVKTPLVDMQIKNQAISNNISEEDVINKIMLEPMPKKKFIEMDELVGTTLYLTSNAARNMTGQSLLIDGGWTVR